MGSKNLKALVSRGTGPAPAGADQKKLAPSVMAGTERIRLDRARQDRVRHGRGHLPHRQCQQLRAGEQRQSEWHDRKEVMAENFAANH